MGEIILQADGIEKAYRKRIILQNISFELREGEILGVAGENGAGKSTLLSLLATIQKPQAGKVYFYGKDVFKEKSTRKILYSFSTNLAQKS